MLEAWGRTIKKFDEQLDHYKKFVEKSTGDKRSPSYYTDEKWSAWVRKKAFKERWSLALTRFALVSSKVTTYQTATLDGIFFCTENHQQLKKYCNCWVEETYTDAETLKRVKAYGKIKDIFVHKVPCHVADEEVYDRELRRKLLDKHEFTDTELHDGFMWREEVFINCDWYSSVDEKQELDLISGLPKVSYDAGLSLNSRISYLKFMHSHNISLWPANGPDHNSEDHKEPLLVLHTNFVQH